VSIAPCLSSADMGWQTPLEILARVRRVGRIDLDPCSSGEDQVCARRTFTATEDGLNQEWGSGLVFVNPPYGRAIRDWAGKCRDQWLEYETEIVALLPARPDTKWFHESVFPEAHLCWWRGRIRFVGATNSAPFPSVVAYWGRSPQRFRNAFAGCGFVWERKGER